MIAGIQYAKPVSSRFHRGIRINHPLASMCRRTFPERRRIDSRRRVIDVRIPEGASASSLPPGRVHRHDVSVIDKDFVLNNQWNLEAPVFDKIGEAQASEVASKVSRIK